MTTILEYYDTKDKGNIQYSVVLVFFFACACSGGGEEVVGDPQARRPQTRSEEGRRAPQAREHEEPPKGALRRSYATEVG